MRLKSSVMMFGLLFGVWFLLTGRTTVASLGVGAVICILITLASVRGAEILSGVHLSPWALGAHLMFALVFLRELLLSNLDVARRVLSPSLPIRPGIVRVKTRLESPLGRFVLANAITLTPGTFTVDVQGDIFYIHWLDVGATDVDGATRRIVSRFEKYLEVAYG